MPEEKELPKTREWTVMFYLASDNPLAPGTVAHLKAMKDAGYHPQVNVLAQFDPHTVNMPVHVFDVNRMEKLKYPDEINIGFGAHDSYVRNLVADKLWDDEINKKIGEALQDRLDYTAPAIPKDMSDEQNPKDSLTKFLNFCLTRYPARHYMLFLVGHGLAVGRDLFLLDEHPSANNGDSGPRSLLLTQLSDALVEFNGKLNKDGQLELIGFHNCSMSGVEVAFQLKGKANYMLATQGPAYIGSWPYRQILIKLFNDLNSSKCFTKEDLSSARLMGKLKDEANPVSTFIRGCFNGNGEAELLDQCRPANQPTPELATALVDAFEGVIADPYLYEPARFERVLLSAETRKLVASHQKNPFTEDEERLKHLNRLLLIDAYSQAIPRVNVKKLLISIFHYCLYNSFDFQLAGYNCDLTLCDLTQIDDLQRSISALVAKLIYGLESANELKDPLVRDLVVLAHWEAQSFYEERYTDLYDFCFCLKTRCENAQPSSQETKCIVDNIRDSCDNVMKKLKRGYDDNDNGVIVRCEFCGPAYQYVHGLSVYFPWAEPVGDSLWDEQYGNFEFRRTNWQDFLKKYFSETMRKPQEEEEDKLEPRPSELNFDENLLELLQEIIIKTYNDDGQLKGGSRDPLGRGGARDPAGDDCDCGSIKNYPHISRSRHSRLLANLASSFERSFPKRKPLV